MRACLRACLQVKRREGVNVCQCVCVYACICVFPLPCVSQCIIVYICQSASLVSLSVRVFHTCQSVSPCVSIPVSLSVRVYPYLSVCQSVCIHTCQSVSPCVSIPVSPIESVCFHTCQSVSPCASIPVSLSVCMYPYLSVCLSCLSDFCEYVWLKGEF